MLVNSGLFTLHKMDDILILFLLERKKFEPRKACIFELAKEVLLNSILNQRNQSYNEDEEIVILKALEVHNHDDDMYIYIYLYIYIYINIYIYTYIYIFFYVYIYILYVYMCICLYIFICFIHIYINICT
jgi:hypothetical protein